MAVTEGQQPSSQITTEYLMSYVAPLDPPMPIDDGLLIVNVRPGGWVKGPNINGRFVAPGADWLRIMPSGAMRLDVRGLIETDDGSHIYITYNGIIAAPTFQTASEKYGWLNEIQAINKMTEIQFGPEGYVKYDVFLVR